jgi:hypothetical protein
MYMCIYVNYVSLLVTPRYSPYTVESHRDMEAHTTVDDHCMWEPHLELD